MSSKRSSLPIRALSLAALFLACPSCRNIQETVLEHLGDHEDKKNLGDAGLTPRKIHPRALSFEISASHVVADSPGGNTQRAFFVEIEARNASSSPVQLPWKDFYIRSDDGRRFRASKFEAWDMEEEEYRRDDGNLEAGNERLYVLTLMTSKNLRLQHILEVCLHWSYRFENRTHRVASRFRVD